MQRGPAFRSAHPGTFTNAAATDAVRHRRPPFRSSFARLAGARELQIGATTARPAAAIAIAAYFLLFHMTHLLRKIHSTFVQKCVVNVRTCFLFFMYRLFFQSPAGNIAFHAFFGRGSG